MKVVNQTQYDTRTLRKLFTALTIHAPVGFSKEGAVLSFVASRRGSLRFSYWRLGKSAPKPRLKISLPKAQVDVKQLAALMRTSMWFAAGYTTRELPTAVRNYAVADLLVTIARLGLPAMLTPVGKPSTPAPVKGDLVEARYTRLLAREKVWEKKLKTAQTFLVKIRRQKRYYERVRARQQHAAAAAQESKALRAQAKWAF